MLEWSRGALLDYVDDYLVKSEVISDGMYYCIWLRV